MKKEIYIIRNKINDKVYIGQAINSAFRWSGHKSCARRAKHCIVIDQAMRDLGIDNFWYEVIEATEDYDNRERYWIDYYNCMLPNGYNKLNGGDGAQSGVNSANALIRDEDILFNIYDDLQYTNEKLKDIALKYDVSLRIISSINRGTAYKNSNFIYPLRARAADDTDSLDIESIILDLTETKISYRQLAKKYNTSTYILQEINKGNKFYMPEYSYPLRVKDDSTIIKIKQMLRKTTLSMHEIGWRCEVSYTKVAQINNGVYHKVDGETYPIRKTTL